MSLNDDDLAAVAILLSAERLAALNELTGSTSKAVELHQETLGVSASLMNVTATIEIALRNAICENLQQHFGVPNWLFRPPAPFQWRGMEKGKIADALSRAKRAKYSKLSQAQKAALDQLAYPNGRPPNTPHGERAKARQRKLRVSDGGVIAELTLHFWKRLYGPHYDQPLWRTTLKRTFPNKSLSRSIIATELENIYQSRNRLAHHEPVLHKRFDDTVNSIQFVVENLGQTRPNPESPLAKLIFSDVADAHRKAGTLHEKLASFRN